MCSRFPLLLCRASHTRERLSHRKREASASRRDNMERMDKHGKAAGHSQHIRQHRRTIQIRRAPPQPTEHGLPLHTLAAAAGSVHVTVERIRKLPPGSFFLARMTTIYIAVVLTAMQVGLAAEKLKDNKSFQSASYGFTVFSILGPPIAALLIIMVFLVILVFNLVATLRFWEERSRRVQFRKPAALEKTRRVATNGYP